MDIAMFPNSMKSITPFLKWPGGKRWFVANHAELLPREFNRYIEPFLGGGSVFFCLKPTRAILSDLNPELMATYQAIRDEWARLTAILFAHQANHDEDYYYNSAKVHRAVASTNFRLWDTALSEEDFQATFEGLINV